MLSDERRRRALAQAFGALGLEVLDAADPVAGAKLLLTPQQEWAALVAELSPRRLAVAKLLSQAKSRTPRPHAFLLTSESSDPPEDAWEATTLPM